MTSFRAIYALSVYLHLFIESMVVAFLNAELKEDVCIEPPVWLQSRSEGNGAKIEQCLV